MIKKIFFVVAICILLVFSASAEDALDISGDVHITAEGISKNAFLDRNLRTFSRGEAVALSIKSETPIGGIWLRYSDTPKGGSMNGNVICEHGMWSEFIPLDGETEVALSFEKVALCELYVYSQGELPREVQTFEFSQCETDLMLFASHSDDDQLFFAGLLPLYVARGNVDVKVCFFTTSYQEISRVHELLSGLWHCGVKNYPIILPFSDEYSESFDGAKRLLEASGYAYDDVKQAIRDVLDTYKPQVVVLHDFKGEYGHGTHIFATAAIVEVIESASDGDFTPHKVYVHLYKENEIALPIDEPLDALGGKSPFNISQEAFQNHKSQHWTWFYGWIYGKNGNITKASQITTYSPIYYGLYLSNVGADTGNDMLENIETHYEYAIRIGGETFKSISQKICEIDFSAKDEADEKPVAAAVSEAVKSGTVEEPFSFGHLLPTLAAVIAATVAIITVTKKARK